MDVRQKESVTHEELEALLREQRRQKEPVTQEELEALLREQPKKVSIRTWRPVTGGVLTAVAGYLNIMFGALMLAGFVTGFIGPYPFGFATGIAMGAVLVSLGAVSLAGGVLGIARRWWAAAEAGAITALLPTASIFLGIVGLVLTSLGKQEFKE